MIVFAPGSSSPQSIVDGMPKWRNPIPWKVTPLTPNITPFAQTDDIRPGACITVELPDGDDLAVYKVNGEFHATENFCPDKGAALSEGVICGQAY